MVSRTLDMLLGPRLVDEPAEVVARFLEDQRNNQVLQHLRELPGPLYLPLNRRWTEELESHNRIRARRSTTAGAPPDLRSVNPGRTCV